MFYMIFCVIGNKGLCLMIKHFLWQKLMLEFLKDLSFVQYCFQSIPITYLMTYHQMFNNFLATHLVFPLPMTSMNLQVNKRVT